MAKKRLNKKVALIGSAVFVFLVLVAIGVILHLSQDPEKFIKDGDSAVKAAGEAVDEELKAEKYREAVRNYGRARAGAKTDSLRVEILFKLADVFLRTGEWPRVLGCWDGIIRIDPKNAEARFGRLEYSYIMADSMRGRAGALAWQEIASQASEFIEVAENTDLLSEDTAQWEAKWKTFGMQASKVSEQLGTYLYLLRGRATLEMARMGAVTDRDESLAQAIDDLEKAQKLEPGNVDAYRYLAQAVITKGGISAERGNLEEREKAASRAKKLLEQAVEVVDADVRAHINLLTIKLALSDREQIQSLEPEYLSLVRRFPSSAPAHSSLAVFYLTSFKNLDKAGEALEKAVELDRENVVYATSLANLCYRKFSIYGQKPQLYKAIEIAKGALTLPDAQESKGPRRWANKMNRISLYTFLANCYIEQVLEPCEVRTESESQKWLTNAEDMVHEIEQFYGSGEEPQVVKWQGMLELAKGNRNTAIKRLYRAYGQLKAASKGPAFERVDSLLSYRLAKVLENTAELGAANELFRVALRIPDRSLADRIDETKPEALLDYADVLLKLRSYDVALSIVSFFESEYWPNERSQTLRINALLGAGRFDEAEEELSKRPAPDDPNTIKLTLALVQAKIEQARRAIALRQMKKSSDIILQGLKVGEKSGEQGADELTMMAELKGYRTALAELVKKLLAIEPDFVDEASIVAVCNNYIAEGKTIEADDLVNRFLGYFPDKPVALFYKQILSEPEPDKVGQQRRREIEERVLSNTADPTLRAMNLGLFYRRSNEPNKAAVEFKKVLEAAARQRDVAELDEEIMGSQLVAASHLADIALRTKDAELAEQIADVAQRDNLDECEGRFYAALAAVAKDEYKDALAKLDECLKQRPVFSHGYLMRSKVNAALGNEHASIEDVQKAAFLNPVDGTIARELAFALYRRNEKLRPNVTSDQIIETRDALRVAMSLNPGQWRLQSFYAEYISEENPEDALAIRQRLQRAVPSVENALLLGKMALRMALREPDVERKEFLFNTAASAFEQGRAIDPQNRAVLEARAECYRLTGQVKKAEELLAQSQDEKLLWRHYFRNGQFEQAREVLEQLYQAEAKDSDVVKGLLVVAEKTADKKSAKKYSEELLSLEDSVENHLAQIQTFLGVGLVKEAEYKLQSFREKYPDEPRAMLFEAWLAMRKGQLKMALELTNRSLQSNQDNATAWWLRGEINRLMANYSQSIIDLKRSKSLSAEPVIRLSLAKTYLRSGRVEDAITELKNVIIDHPQASMEGRRMLEQVYKRAGMEETLKRFYDATLAELPDSVFWRNRAGALAIAAGDFTRAEELYGQAWQKSKKDGRGDATAFDGYLQSLVAGGKLGKVLEEGGKYVDSDFASIAYLRMAQAKMELGDKASAIQYCRKAVDRVGTEESFVAAMLRDMSMLVGEGEMLKYCEEKLKANPDSLTANFAMFNLVQMKAEHNRAIGYIDKCLQIVEPNSPRWANYIVKKAEVLLSAYAKTSDNSYLKRVIVVYESLLAKLPNNAGVLNNLAYILAENNVRLGEALGYAKRAYELMPNNPSYLDTYAYVLYKNGKFSEASEFLHASLQQYEQDKISAPAEVYEHLGQVCEEVGSGRWRQERVNCRSRSRSE